MARNAPRSVSSNPNLAESRKANIQGLNLHSAALSNEDSLSTPTILSSPRMATAQTSVLARAKAFEHRAQAGRGAGTFSPTTSPPPMSPFVGTRILVPQSLTKVSPVPNDKSTRTVSASLPNTPVATHSTRSVDEQIREDSPTRPSAPGAVSAESLPGSIASRKPSLAPTEGGASSDDDQTPRQSTTYPSVSTSRKDSSTISRKDSSRQPTYSLKAQTYSPELEQERRGSNGRAEPPRLPKLYFEGSLAEDGTHPSLPSAKSIRSPYSSPSTELARAGWSNPADAPKSHKHGQSLTVPPVMHQSHVVDSPEDSDAPPDDLDASNRSFFWHSPNDTDETDDDEEEDNTGGFPSLPRSSDTSMTSANVFGPGGPSDWEHFYGGDYETELVDDTDIYLTEKEKDRIKLEETERVKSVAAARRKSEDDAADAAEATRKFEETRKEEEAQARLRAEPNLPTIAETIQEEPEEEDLRDDIRQTDVNYEPEAETLDGFARSPAPATPAVFQEGFQEKSREVQPLPTVVEKTSRETIKAVDRDADDDHLVEGTNQAAETAPADVQDEKVRNDAVEDEAADVPVIEEPEANTNDEAQTETTTRTPPPPEIKMPETEIRSPEDAKSGSLSPPIDDPNAGQITISMVLPAEFNPVTGPASRQSQASQASPPLTTPGARKSIFPQADELPNPYSGLSPMAKASLNRFVRMLREEERADTDQDKFGVFIAFAQHEMKLRATLYDMDDEEMSLPASKRASVRSSINKKLGKSSTSLRSKPLPAAPGSMPGYDPTLGRNQSFGVSAANRVSTTNLSAGPPPNPPPNRSPPPAPSNTAAPDKSSKSSDESFVMVDTPESKDAANKNPLDSAKKASLETLNKSIDLIAPRTSIISDSLTSESTTSPDGAMSDAQSNSPLPGAQILNHSLSVKSNESKPYDGDKATNRRSIYGPFSGELRSSSIHRRGSMESVRTLRSIDPDRKLAEPSSDPSDSHIDVHPPRSPTSRAPILEPLLAVVPQSNVLREEPQQLVRLRFDMDNIVDDFSFIHKTVLAWDSGAKVKRERREHERQMRIADNERRVEDLFDDNVIGYADISALEAEFKQTESVKKAEEEREEVESFVASVFDVVWARINYEMDQLTPLYQEATKLVADASAGRQMFENTEERVPIAPIMEVLLVLYQKLMIRHQKAFEAVLERDRRLKKTEVSPWFAIGQIDKVKRIEKRFEDAEKKAILEFCRQRDERANLLMDVLDQHTLRGVGANQDYMESVMQAVRKIAIQLAKSDPNLDAAPSDEVIKAKFITIALSRSSEQIVRTFHVADMLLNAADYEVSVANAKLSNADTAAFRRLKEAKAKEDAKLAADLEHRINLIKGDTLRTQEEVGKLMALLGQEDPDLAFDIGRERDKRLVAALNGKVRTSVQHLQPPGLI